MACSRVFCTVVRILIIALILPVAAGLTVHTTGAQGARPLTANDEIETWVHPEEQLLIVGGGATSSGVVELLALPTGECDSDTITPLQSTAADAGGVYQFGRTYSIPGTYVFQARDITTGLRSTNCVTVHVQEIIPHLEVNGSNGPIYVPYLTFVSLSVSGLLPGYAGTIQYGTSSDCSDLSSGIGFLAGPDGTYFVSHGPLPA